MKILVVEDEPLIRLGMVSLVEDWGYTPLEASNADEAIAQIERDGDVRIIITDVDMPGSMDGVKLAHFVRHRWPPIQLIVISGKIGANEVDLPVGARFFSKPCREEALLSTIRELGDAGGAP